jgi:hypothetical protein
MEERGKQSILSLEHEGNITTDPAKIQEIIYIYYKKLFGKSQAKKVRLSQDTWSTDRNLSPADNVELTKPFSEEVRKSVFEIYENTAFGPDGFGVTFYKHCWDIIKGGCWR